MHLCILTFLPFLSLNTHWHATYARAGFDEAIQALSGVSSMFRNAHFPRGWWGFAPEPFPSCFSLGAPFKTATHRAQQLFRNKDLTPRWGILGDESSTIHDWVSPLKPAWLTYYELVSLPLWLANQLTLLSVPRGLSVLSNWASSMTCKLLRKSTLGGVVWVAVTEDAYSRKFSSQQVWNSCAPTYCQSGLEKVINLSGPQFP